MIDIKRNVLFTIPGELVLFTIPGELRNYFYSDRELIKNFKMV